MRVRQIGWLLRRRWWLILAPAVVGVALSAVIVQQRPSHYVAEGSYVVRVSVADDSDRVRAAATLSSTDKIMSTYAGIARSSLVAARARENLELSEREADTVEVTSSVVPGSNIVLIGARSQDPGLALDMATVAGDLTASYVRGQDYEFLLTPLDEPTLPQEPKGSGGAELITKWGLIGLGLGVGLAVATEHGLPAGPPRRRLRRIIDERSSAYSRRYFQMRLHEELSRSRGAGRPFSVGVLQVLRRRPQGVEVEEPARLSDAELAGITAGIRQTLRQQDILGHLGRGRFAAILPDVDLDDARDLVTQWRRSTSPRLLPDPLGRDLTVSVSACEFRSTSFVGDPEAELVVSAL
jgi:GGDEF domain-containing protein